MCLSTSIFAIFTIETIGNETGHLLKFVDLSRKWINSNDTLHMLRWDIAASSLKILCKHYIPVERYGKQIWLFLY